MLEMLAAIVDTVRRELPDYDLVRRIWHNVRDLHDVHGVSEEAMASIVPESLRDIPFRAGNQDTSGQPVEEVLPAHDAETISSGKAQHRLGKLTNRVRYDRYLASIDELPETRRQQGTGDLQGEKETRGLAKARQRSQSGPGATTFLRARPVNSARTVPASESVPPGRRFWLGN